MKAAVFTDGRTVEVADVPLPAPKAGEVQIRVRAAGICGSDLHGWRSGDLWFPEAAPVVLGHELAGDVSAVGSGVESFSEGDRVSVQPQITCGECYACRKGVFQLCPNVRHIGIWYDGGFAEYAVAPEGNVYKIPESMSFDVGAIVDVYGCAVHCLHRMEEHAADFIAVIGTGSIGVSAAQVLRASRDSRVIVLGRRDEALERIKSIHAADEVVNVKGADAAAEVRRITGGKGAEIVIEAVGVKSETIATAFEIVAPDGVVGVMGEYFGAGEVPIQRGMEKQIDLLWVTGYGKWNGADEFQETIELLGSSRVDGESIITHRYPLEAIAEAFDAADNKAASNALKVLVTP